MMAKMMITLLGEAATRPTTNKSLRSSPIDRPIDAAADVAVNGIGDYGHWNPLCGATVVFL